MCDDCDEIAEGVFEVRVGADGHPLYAKREAAQKIAFVLDAEARVLYVDPANLEAAKKSLVATELDENTWEVPLGGQAAAYRLRDLPDFPAHHRTGNVIGISKSKCVLVKEGRCVNLVDDEGNPSGSMKAPEDFHACGVGSEVCKETLQKVTLDVYPESECKGTPAKKTIEMYLCDPR